MDELLEIVIEIIIELIGALIDDGSRKRRRYKRSSYTFPKSHSSNYYSGISKPYGGDPVAMGYVSALNDEKRKSRVPDYTAVSKDVDEQFKKQVEQIHNEDTKKAIYQADKDIYAKPEPKAVLPNGSEDEYKEVFIQENKSKEIRFGTVMLRYIFFQDDLKLSLREISHIKKYFRKNAKYLEKSDLIAIKELLKITPDLEAVKSFFVTNNLTQKQFNRVYSSIHKIVNDNSKYNYSLSSIKTKFMEDGVF